jgi:hypothetical protein
VRPHSGFTSGYADIRAVISAADMTGAYAICGRRPVHLVIATGWSKALEPWRLLLED